MVKPIAKANPVSKTGFAILRTLQDHPDGLSRHKLVNLIPQFADESVRRMISTLLVRGYIQLADETQAIARFVLTEQGTTALEEPPLEKQRQMPPDGWTPQPWVHPIRRQTQALPSDTRRYVLPTDPTTQVRPYYPPARRNPSERVQGD